MKKVKILLVLCLIERSKMCGDGCVRCTVPDAQVNFDCKECLPKYFLGGGKCTACHKSCETCRGSAKEKCLSCASGYTPGPGSFPKRCYKCDPTCKTCLADSNPNKCTSCKKSSDRILRESPGSATGKCLSPCPFGTYPGTKFCGTCHGTCDGCTGAC